MESAGREDVITKEELGAFHDSLEHTTNDVAIAVGSAVLPTTSVTPDCRGRFKPKACNSSCDDANHPMTQNPATPPTIEQNNGNHRGRRQKRRRDIEISVEVALAGGESRVYPIATIADSGNDDDIENDDDDIVHLKLRVRRVEGRDSISVTDEDKHHGTDDQRALVEEGEESAMTSMRLDNAQDKIDNVTESTESRSHLLGAIQEASVEEEEEEEEESGDDLSVDSCNRQSSNMSNNDSRFNLGQSPRMSPRPDGGGRRPDRVEALSRSKVRFSNVLQQHDVVMEDLTDDRTLEECVPPGLVPLTSSDSGGTKSFVSVNSKAPYFSVLEQESMDAKELDETTERWARYSINQCLSNRRLSLGSVNNNNNHNDSNTQNNKSQQHHQQHRRGSSISSSPSWLRQMYLDADMNGGMENSGSRLHELCARPLVKLKHLERILREEPSAVCTRDDAGCLPLHVLGNNEMLVEIGGKKMATEFGWLLMKAYPAAITTPDDSGCMPFVSTIEEWFKWVYESHQSETTNSATCSYTAASPNSTRRLDGTKEGLVRYSEAVFPNVEVYDQVEWCFSMLSLALDGLGGRDGGFQLPQDHKTTSRRISVSVGPQNTRGRTDLARHLIRRMPTLLKTVLLAQDDGKGTRQRLMQTSIVRRMLLCHESVGPWLIKMLRNKGIPSRRAVDYIRAVSSTTVNDYLGGFSTIQGRDERDFRQEREQVFRTLAALDNVDLSLIVLPDEEQERAARATVIWYVMMQHLLRPFVVNLVLVDFVLHFVLLLAFRNVISADRDPDNTYTNADVGWQEESSWWVVMLTSMHYIIRRVCELVSIISISRKVFVSYITNLWTILDLLSTILPFSATVSHNYRLGFYTFVLGLLWVKVLSFLKVVNRPMATFIITLLRILKELRYFALVLVVIILMFGDMFHASLSFKDSGLYCQTNSGTMGAPGLDFCSPEISDSFLRVYALLLGDFELDDYRETLGMLILFVVFTAVGVIVMLNVLIAVISSSYEDATTRSMLVFGRARMAFVAQTHALEKFLRPKSPCGENVVDHRARNRKWPLWFDVAWRILRHLTFITMLSTTFAAELYLLGRTFRSAAEEYKVVLPIFLVMLFCILTLANIVLCMYVFEFWFGCVSWEVVGRVLTSLGLPGVWKALVQCNAYLSQAVASRLFGFFDQYDCELDEK